MEMLPGPILLSQAHFLEIKQSAGINPQQNSHPGRFQPQKIQQYRGKKQQLNLKLEETQQLNINLEETQQLNIKLYGRNEELSGLMDGSKHPLGVQNPKKKCFL